MISTSLEQLREGLWEDEELSGFQRALLAIHLQRVCVPILSAVGLFTVFYVLIAGQAGAFILPPEEWTQYNHWRLIIGAINIWIVLAMTTSKFMRRNFHTTFTLAFVPAAFFSGFFLSKVTFPEHSVTYTYYLQPFYTLVVPGGIRKRLLVTSESFVILLGIWLSVGWNPYLLTSVGLSLWSIILISVIVGHFTIYRLNKITFFQERKLERKNKRIRELAQYDQLTGLYTRRELDKRLGEEYERARRYDKNFSVLMIDLDHFKDVNDRFGHDVGDRVLEMFGEIVTDLMEEKLRTPDVAGRYGGEEFCIMLPETDRGGAKTVGDRIRETLKSIEFTSHTGETFTVTCSVGAAELGPDVDKPEDLVRRADRAMYQAKDHGRDTVRVYSEIE